MKEKEMRDIICCGLQFKFMQLLKGLTRVQAVKAGNFALGHSIGNARHGVDARAMRRTTSYCDYNSTKGEVSRILAYEACYQEVAEVNWVKLNRLQDRLSTQIERFKEEAAAEAAKPPRGSLGEVWAEARKETK